MKKLLLLTSLFLAGCGSLPVHHKFPNLPDELAKTCVPLVLLEGSTTTLTKLMDTVAKNYSSRHECSAQLEAIQEWYREQKKIADKI